MNRSTRLDRVIAFLSDSTPAPHQDITTLKDIRHDTVELQTVRGLSANSLKRVAFFDTNFAARLLNDDDEQLLQELLQFHDIVRDRLFQQCTRRIREAIGIALEHFSATAAWLFFLDGDALVSVVAQNGQNDIRIPVGQGIVGTVMQTGEPYIAHRVSIDPHYLALISSTESEMAVPIRDPDTGDVIAVLNFEANHAFAFSASRLWESKELIPSLLPDILVLRELYARRTPAPSLAFNRIGWGIDEILTEYCTFVTEALEARGSRPSCTIWELDQPKEELWAIATDGYDFEYIRHPIAANPTESYIAMVAGLKRGTIDRSRIEDLGVYLRRDKAHRMGVSAVIATPIFRPRSGELFGVLNFYSFHEPQGLSDRLVATIADAIGQIIEEYEHVVVPIATSRFNDIISRQKSLSMEDTFDLILQTLVRFLHADAGSILARLEGSAALKCVATTGLAHNGTRLLDPSKAVYDLERDRGFTCFVAHRPGLCLRKNDIPSPKEPVRIDGESCTVEPQNKYTEVFSLSDTDHRRFLGISIGRRGFNETAGVVRLIRAHGSRPFLLGEELLLRSLATAMRRVFDEWLLECNLQPFVRTLSRQLFGSLEMSPREEAAFTRLIRPVGTEFGSSMRLVGELLQQVVTFLRRFECLHASVREVACGDDGREYLRLFHFHSMQSSEMPTAAKYPAITREAGSIGWRAIEKWRILTFKRRKCGQLFKPVHSDSHRVESGIVVPFATWTAGRCVKWVLSIDFVAQVEWNECLIEFVVQAVRKLSAILSDAAAPLLLRPEDSLKGFLASGVQATSAEWATLSIQSSQRRNAVVAKFSRARQEIEAWTEMPGEVGAFGVSASLDGHCCRIPLRFGPVEAGHLTCGSSKINYLRNAPVLDRLISLWTSLTGFGGDDESMWKSKTTSMIDDEYPLGIRIWDISSHWYPSADVARSLKKPLRVSREDIALLSCS